MTDVQAAPAITSITVRNPADGSVVGSVPIDTPDTVAAKAAALRAAQPEWEALGPSGRKPWLLKLPSCRYCVSRECPVHSRMLGDTGRTTPGWTAR